MLKRLLGFLLASLFFLSHGLAISSTPEIPNIKTEYFSFFIKGDVSRDAAQEVANVLERNYSRISNNLNTVP